MLKRIFYLNEQGNRKNLEDSLFPSPTTAGVNDKVFVVCDGVGGEQKGEVASKIVCQTIGETLSNSNSVDYTSEEIKAATLKAVGALHAYADQFPDAERMSTTLTLVCIGKKTIKVAWCGDSRIYHIRDGKVIWKSKDHSLVQSLIDAGEISEEEASRHPKKNVIMRSLSAGIYEAPVDMHTIYHHQSGDFLLLCTDGLLERIGEMELYDILGPQQTEPEKQKLFLKYCKDKTGDNFSMYLLEFTGIGTKSRFKRVFVSILVFVFALVLGLIYFLKSSGPSPQIIQTVDTNSKSKPDNLLQHSNQIALPVITKKPVKNN